MTPQDFSFLAALLRRRCGLMLPPGKAGLMARKLAPVLRRFDFPDLAALVADLKAGHEVLAEAVSEAMTVNETSFFRDPAQFAHLRQAVLPHLLARRGQARLTLWSAACATGQEAWSLAMLLDEMDLGSTDITLIASDLSAAAIARAKAGRYSAFEVQRGLDAAHLERYFERDGADWVVGQALRGARTRIAVHFVRFNLLDGFGWLGEVHAILCRNVLMYFDVATRADVLARMAGLLADDGALILGDSDGAQALPPGLDPWPGMDGVWRHGRKAGLAAAIRKAG